MEKDQQEKIDQEGLEGSTAETPSVEHAKSRDNAPGGLGGHVLGGEASHALKGDGVPFI
jgi:hypothetical protein